MGNQAPHHTRCGGLGLAVVREHLPIHPRPLQRVPVGRSAHHGPINQLELFQAAFQAGKAAVELDREAGPIPFELVHQLGAQGRNRAVLFGI